MSHYYVVLLIWMMVVSCNIVVGQVLANQFVHMYVSLIVCNAFVESCHYRMWGLNEHLSWFLFATLCSCYDNLTVSRFRIQYILLFPPSWTCFRNVLVFFVGFPSLNKFNMFDVSTSRLKLLLIIIFCLLMTPWNENGRLQICNGFFIVLNLWQCPYDVNSL